MSINGHSGNVKENTDLHSGVIATTSIDELMLKCQEILRREITNLMVESSKGKLSPNSAKSLSDYIKLLDTLKDKEADLLEELSDTQLKKLVK